MSHRLLVLVIRSIAVPVAYAIWSGLGTAGIAVVGVLPLQEHLDLAKVSEIAMITVGVLNCTRRTETGTCRDG